MSLIDSPLLRIVEDDTGKFRLASPMRYGWAVKNAVVEVPDGFITDFASIPVPLRNLFNINGRHRLPAILHDYLYAQAGHLECEQSYSDVEGAVDLFAPRTVTYTRAEADQAFYTAMVEMQVSGWRRALMYRAVRLFGGIHLKRTGGKEWRKQDARG